MNIEEENRAKNGFSVYCASTTKTMAVLQTGMEESEEKDDLSGMQSRDPCLPWRGKLGPGHTLR